MVQIDVVLVEREICLQRVPERWRLACDIVGLSRAWSQYRDGHADVTSTVLEAQEYDVNMYVRESSQNTSDRNQLI